MAIFKCKYCGKEFKDNPTKNRKYCSRECMAKAMTGKKRLNMKKRQPKVEKIKVICAECGKVEYVWPCRAKGYVCCSVPCLAKYNSRTRSIKIKCTCPVCGNIFELKPYSYNKIKTQHCCCRECADKLKQTTYAGEKNHQYGLKGILNASFKGVETKKKNSRLEDVFVYKPERPDVNKDKRITKHRLLILENYEKFDPCFFTEDSGFKIFKPDKKLKICVHHIDGNHSNNILENLVPLTNAAHRYVHNNYNALALKVVNKIIGVFKRGELLETPGEVNQQPNFSSDTLEGSETNSRVFKEDSNADTSALLNNVKNIIDDYIVQTRNIAQEGYKLSIKEILESEIKSSEVNT